MSFYGHIDTLVEKMYIEREKNEQKQSEQWVMDELALLLVLRLMKKGYEERGVPYHFCREDYKRNKAGQSMNGFCETLWYVMTNLPIRETFSPSNPTITF